MQFQFYQKLKNNIFINSGERRDTFSLTLTYSEEGC